MFVINFKVKNIVFILNSFCILMNELIDKIELNSNSKVVIIIDNVALLKF